MDKISTEGWIAIIFLAVLLLSINLALLSLLRSKKNPSKRIYKSMNLLQNPWDEEDKQWGELKKKVEGLTDRSKEEE